MRAVRQDHGRPVPVQAGRQRLLPEVPGRDAFAVGGQARAAGGLRQHPAHRRAVQRRVRRDGQPDAALRRSRGGGRAQLVRQGGRTRPGPALPGRYPHRGAGAFQLRGRDDPEDGVPGLLPGHRGPHHLGPRAGHPGRARPRLGHRVAGLLRHGDHRAGPAGAQTAVRALPQPRPGLDARHRHRLRRAPPQRGHPLRQRQVRRGPRRPGRHLRHDQGQAGGQGRLAGARLPVLDGRQDHQGDAAGRHGQGRAAQQDLRRNPPPLRRGRGVPGVVLDRSRGRQGRRHRQGTRRPEAAVGSARLRGDHVERAARRPHPDHAPRAGRRHHHPVRLPDL